MSLYKRLKTEFPSLASTCFYDQHEAQQHYGINTFAVEIPLAAAIKLNSSEQISHLLSLANQYQFIVNPISSGHNWGYGSISYGDDGRSVVLLDLSMMAQIKEVDKKLGLISVEPGVTQQQLFDYLEKNNWPFMTPVTGAGPSCSILSNALERGYGITPYTDHFAAVNAMKVILPHPELCSKEYQSGVASLDASNDGFVDKSYKWGLGPYLDGLFTQSSMGIATELTLRLAKKKDAFLSFYIKCYDKNKINEAVNFIQNTLCDFEGIVGSINLMDRRRILSMVADNPNGNGQHKVMSEEQVVTLAKQHDVPEWMIVGSIYGQNDLVKVVKKSIKRSAVFSEQVLFSDSWLLKLAKALSDLIPVAGLKKIKQQLATLDEGKEVMQGKPNQVALPLAYWRNPRTSADKNTKLNPDQDSCGLLWYAPLIPMNIDKITEFVEFIRQTTPKYGIEPLITFTNLKHDCIDATIPLIFDVKNNDAVKKAHACLDELFDQGCIKGFVPYRINVKQQKEKLDKNAMHWQAVKKIKQVLDPNSIISPNRYNPS